MPKKSIQTSSELWSLFSEFKAWLKDNPRYENVFNNKLSKVVQIPRERPLTWSRFDSWINNKGIITDLEDYRQNTQERYKEFKGVIKRINQEMYADKIEGATVGIYNANIISRLLGLTDKKEETKKKEKIIVTVKDD